MDKKYKFYYKNKRVQDLTEKELRACSKLYSENYGEYSEASKKAGEQIKMLPEYYRKNYFKKNYYIVLAYKNSVLVGQALYLRKKIDNQKCITWIVQLVVKKKERGQHIAKKLMQSIWGFSNDYAWGLVTPNIITIKTLESTTFRRCNPKIIQKHLKQIKKIAADIHFINLDKICVDSSKSIVDTEFFVKRELDPQSDYNDKWLLGDLREGQEWLAFTFNCQNIDLNKYKTRANELIEFSEETLKDAYSRMRIKKHRWAQYSKSEVNYILSKTNIATNCNILDMGCGIGRHSVELAKRNYNVVGIDFSEKNIAYSRRMRKQSGLKNIRFYHSDARNFVSKKNFDMILCLYDVIGSFPDEKDNLDIIRNAYKLLSSGGYFVVSVMNFELTEKIVPSSQKADLLKHPEVIISLSPSKDMMTTGNIFNPSHLAIDTKTNLVYRKEQFISSKADYLPAEYVIRDKRYTMKEISGILE